jgi:DME family drug/metabolite transporter
MTVRRPTLGLRGLATPRYGILAIALAAALWGTDALFRRGLALELPSSFVVFAEHLILVVLTLPLLLRARRYARTFGAREWTAIVIVGAGASALATFFFTNAFKYGDPTTPLLLQKLQPVFAVTGARIFLRERQLPRYAAFFLPAFAGAYLITFPDPQQVSVASLAPALLSIGAAALWGLGTVFGRQLTPYVPFPELTALRFAFGLPVAALLVWVDLGKQGLPRLSGNEGVALLLLALIPGLIALLIYYRGLKFTPASAATLAELVFPLTAVTVNYVAFGETLTPTQWAGLLMLAGTVTWMSIVAGRGSSAVGIEIRELDRLPEEGHGSTSGEPAEPDRSR